MSGALQDKVCLITGATSGIGRDEAGAPALLAQDAGVGRRRPHGPRRPAA